MRVVGAHVPEPLPQDDLVVAAVAGTQEHVAALGIHEDAVDNFLCKALCSRQAGATVQLCSLAHTTHTGQQDQECMTPMQHGKPCTESVVVQIATRQDHEHISNRCSTAKGLKPEILTHRRCRRAAVQGHSAVTSEGHVVFFLRVQPRVPGVQGVVEGPFAAEAQDAHVLGVRRQVLHRIVRLQRRGERKRLRVCADQASGSKCWGLEGQWVRTEEEQRL